MALPLAGAGSGGREPYRQAILDAAPVAYWPMQDQNAGLPAIVEAVAGLNGTLTGYSNPGTLQQPGPIAHETSYGILFDNVDDYIQVADAAASDLGDGPFTYEFWFTRGQSGAVVDIVMHKGAGGAVIWFENTDTLKLRKQGVANIAESSITITDTGWHHAAVTKTGAASQVFIDGIDRTSVIGNQAIGTNADALVIGSSSPAPASGNPNFYSGKLAHFAIYNRVLSTAEIGRHAAYAT